MDATRSWSDEHWRMRFLMERQWAERGCRHPLYAVGWGYSEVRDGQPSLFTRSSRMSPASRDLPRRMNALMGRFLKKIRRMITPAERKAWGLQ